MLEGQPNVVKVRVNGSTALRCIFKVTKLNGIKILKIERCGSHQFVGENIQHARSNDSHLELGKRLQASNEGLGEGWKARK